MSCAGKMVLIVEDEPTIGKVCLRTLTADGIAVDIASNGRIALAIMNRQAHDLYLIDIRTPEVNGMQLYEHLSNEHPEVLGKVVFTSGDTLSGDLGLFIKGTGRPFLAKPFTPQQLRATVKEALAAQPVAADSKSGECRPKEALAARPVAADRKP